jgi:uncharacterized protein (DUF111 family)
MRALFLDCISGISGDMMVGALVDLGVKPSTLEWELSKLSLGDFHLHFDRQKRKEIEGVKFTIHEGAVHTLTRTSTATATATHMASTSMITMTTTTARSTTRLTRTLISFTCAFPFSCRA